MEDSNALANEMEKQFAASTPVVSAQPTGQNSQMPSTFEEYVRQQTTNSKYVSSLPIGEYRMKFIGAEMVNKEYNGERSISPRYKFIHEGVEKELDSKNRKLFVLNGKVGMDVILVKQSKGGKADYFVK